MRLVRALVGLAAGAAVTLALALGARCSASGGARTAGFLAALVRLTAGSFGPGVLVAWLVGGAGRLARVQVPPWVVLAWVGAWETAWATLAVGLNWPFPAASVAAGATVGLVLGASGTTWEAVLLSALLVASWHAATVRSFVVMGPASIWYDLCRSSGGLVLSDLTIGAAAALLARALVARTRR